MDPCNKKDERTRRYLNWIASYRESSDDVAKSLGTKVENILALSALESAWGQGPFARENGNNFFSLHAPPHWVGKIRPVARNPKVRMPVFNSYDECVKMFERLYGNIVKGITVPQAFAAALQDAGKYGINTDGSKVPTFVHDVALIAHNFAIRLFCK